MYYEKKYKEALEGIEEILSSGQDSIKMSRLKLRLQGIFPELAESNDEKLRKELISYHRSMAAAMNGNRPCVHEAWIAWLEKQGDRPNSVYDKELSEILGRVIRRYINDPNIPYTEREKVSMEIIPYVERLEKQVEQKPAWSKEDEQYLLICKNALAKYQVSDKWDANIISRWLENKLKSLRPQKQDVMSEDEFRHIVGYLVQDIVANEHMADTEKQPTKFFAEKYFQILRPHSAWKPSEEMLEALYRATPKNVKELSEDEMLLDKLYQGLKYGRVLSNK